MRRVRRAWGRMPAVVALAAVLGTGAATGAPSAASAAQPAGEVSLSANTPGAPVTLTLRATALPPGWQAPGLTLSLPGFTSDTVTGGAPAAPSVLCPSAQEALDACPPASRIGGGELQASFVPSSGSGPAQPLNLALTVWAGPASAPGCAASVLVRFALGGQTSGFPTALGGLCRIAGGLALTLPALPDFYGLAETQDQVRLDQLTLTLGAQRRITTVVRHREDGLGSVRAVRHRERGLGSVRTVRHRERGLGSVRTVRHTTVRSLFRAPRTCDGGGWNAGLTVPGSVILIASISC